MNKIMVSICCITYNHEKHIADAIEGFLMQKTNFPIEILIHDDASTDNTAQIIRAYEAKYPGIIKPIYQSVNQYSLGVKISATHVWPNAKGKYIALCEGDDYWTDPYKLQKQINYMEDHSECSMCFHAAKIVDVTINEPLGLIKPFKKNAVLPANKLFLGGGSHCPTASIVFLTKLVKILPRFFYEMSIGDMPLAWILSNQGRVAYINEVMSVRNLWVTNSWNTIHVKQNNKEDTLSYLKMMIKGIVSFDEFSHYKYSKDINRVVLEWKIKLLKTEGFSHVIHRNDIKEHISKLSILDKVKFYMKYFCPKLYVNMAGLKNKF